MNLKTILYISVIAVSIQAQQGDFASPPGGAAIPLQYAPPVHDVIQPVVGIQPQQIQQARSWVEENPKLAIGGIATAAVAAFFGLSYRYSESFKKDIDAKIAKVKNYFNNNYKFSHLLGFSLGVGAVSALGYSIYTNRDNIVATFRNY